jgi:hypothetical protein
VPKQRLVESVVATFRSFGLLVTFDIAASALEGFVQQAGAYTRPLFGST